MPRHDRQTSKALKRKQRARLAALTPGARPTDPGWRARGHKFYEGRQRRLELAAERGEVA